MDVLGIDISKADFHACLLQGSQQKAHSFPNNAKGYGQLRKWLKNRRAREIHACMEATGGYWMGLATVLFENDVQVSVVNPARTALFARSQLRRTKTDTVDAQMIAEFCQTQRPGPWSPPPPEILELRGLLSYRQELVNERLRITQVAQTVHVSKKLRQFHKAYLKTVKDGVAAVESQLQDVVKLHSHLASQVAKLKSVKGVGFLTAATFVAELPVDRLRDGKAAAAYVGLSPSERQSGTSVNGKPHICKTGNAKLRRDLYMPAIVAMRHNPILAAFAARLEGRGKPPKVIIIAVMRKLVVLAFNLLKGTTPARVVVSA